MKIDAQTVVPVGWLFIGFAACISPVIIASMWVSTVSFRLSRIEDKLGIPKLETSAEIIPRVYANGLKSP